MKKFLALILSVIFVFGAFTLLSCDNSTEELLDFDSEVTFQDKTRTYSGNPLKIFISGKPKGATVTYEYINERGQVVEDAIEIGVYSVTATVSKEGYNDLVLDATLTIVAENDEEEQGPINPEDLPNLSYKEKNKVAYLYEVNNNTTQVDMLNIVAEETAKELNKYTSFKWILKAIGNVKAEELIFENTHLIDFSKLSKEQYSAVCMVKYGNNYLTPFEGKVDFYDILSDGFVWNDVSENALNYIVSHNVIKAGVQYISNANYDGIFENGQCFSMKDGIFDCTEEQIQAEIDARAAQIRGEGDGVKSYNHVLNCYMMLRPLHSKEYYKEFKTEGTYLTFNVIFYCDDEEANDFSRNSNDFNNGSRNVDKALNEWFTIEIKMDTLLTYYDTYINATNCSTGSHTALIGMMHDQLNYTSKIEDIHVFKVEALMYGFELIEM